MPLEATIFCLDNSGYARNADYNITRLAAQIETLQFLGAAKIRNNNESFIGVMSMAAPRVQVHISLSRDMAAIMVAARSLRPQGYCEVLSALRVAQLTLKNRQNKNQRQRIVLFIGSALRCDREEFLSMAKQLKKNGVYVDIIHFGEENLQEGSPDIAVIQEFMEIVNQENTSRLVTVPTTTHRFSDDVLLSPLGKDVGANASASAYQRIRAPVASTATSSAIDSDLPEGFEGLEEMDPDLALAIRLSLQEAAAPSSGSAATTATAITTPATTATATATTADMDMDDDYDEDAALAEAIALSMLENDDMTDDTTTNTETETKKEENKEEKKEEKKDNTKKKDDKKDNDDDADAEGFAASLLGDQ